MEDRNWTCPQCGFVNVPNPEHFKECYIKECGGCHHEIGIVGPIGIGGQSGPDDSALATHPIYNKGNRGIVGPNGPPDLKKNTAFWKTLPKYKREARWA